MSIKQIAKVAVPIAVTLLPLVALGAALTSPTNPLGETGAVDLNTAENIIQKIANFLITVSIVIAVFFIVWGAIVWMSAGGNEDRAKSGKKFIINGIIGAAIVFAIGLILSTLKNTIATKFFGS